ncbi:hypothetical protein HAX54_013361 [Datura stramonium]|uniref:Uncharacterized protein n=1 Tax=Datura stramonium TaxID=4076 RepID=A0ABS8TN09_DATST|nr:hypothetical protein [Datura stramonium]
MCLVVATHILKTLVHIVEDPIFLQDCENAPGRGMGTIYHFYDGYNCNLCGGQGEHWGDYPNYCASFPKCSNEDVSCSFEFDMNKSKASEGQNVRFERIQVMLQTLLEREYNLEEINKSILANDEPKFFYDHDTNYGNEEEGLDQVEIVSHDWLLKKDQPLGVYKDDHEGNSWMVEEFSKMHIEQSQEVKLLEIATRKLKTN